MVSQSQSTTQPLLQTPTVLADIQADSDKRGVFLREAGVAKVAMPLSVNLASSEQLSNTPAVELPVTAALTVGLDAAERGAHMSRFVVLLNEWRQAKQAITSDCRQQLQQLAEVLQSNTAELTLALNAFVDKAAPVSGLSAPFDVGVTINATHEVDTGVTRSRVSLALPISTLCPCSKAISDYGAHNQRALLSVTLAYMDAAIEYWPGLNELVAKLDETASCPVFPILKRPDEKWVTERQYDNPKFVEDVARDATLVLRQLPKIAGFSVEVQALESIHGHNAVATHAEGVLANPWLK